MKNSIRNVGVITALLLVSMSTQAGLLRNSAPGDTVTYTAITEDISGYGTFGGTYGTPTINGDLLDFNPLGLQAQATGGADSENDAELRFGVEAHQGYHISDIQFGEAGESRLRDPGSVGTVSTFTEVTATFFVDILELDHGATALPGSVDDQYIRYFAYFDITGGLGINLWDGNIDIDIDQILLDNEVNYEFGATEVHITLDNIMYAASEVGTTATIKKKDADGFTITAVSVPEPASVVLLLGTTSGLVFIRRRIIG